MSHLPCIAGKPPVRIAPTQTQDRATSLLEREQRTITFSTAAAALPPSPAPHDTAASPVSATEPVSKRQLKRLQKQSQHAKLRGATSTLQSSPHTATVTPSVSASRDSVDVRVQHTNDDSVVSKRSAVAQGYVDDPFLRYFVRKPSRRSPLINRGYYLRMVAMTDAIDRCLDQLLATATTAAVGAGAEEECGGTEVLTEQPVQVISLGAGFDTFAFRTLLSPTGRVGTQGEDSSMKSHDTTNTLPRRGGVIHFYDVDFPAVMQTKAALMCTAPSGTFPASWQVDPTHSHVPVMGCMENGSRYYAIGANLRLRHAGPHDSLKPAHSPQVERSNTAVSAAPASLLPLSSSSSSSSTASVPSSAATHDWLTALRAASDVFSCTAPTLLYAECVLQYLPAEDAAALLRHVAQTFPHAVLLTYDQLHDEDSFGAVMTQSLRQRGSALLGVRACPDERAMRRRAQHAGLRHVQCANFYDLSRRWVSAAGRRAWMAARESFDELEEWSEMCEHYGITLASNDAALFARCIAVLPDYHPVTSDDEASDTNDEHTGKDTRHDVVSSSSFTCAIASASVCQEGDGTDDAHHHTTSSTRRTRDSSLLCYTARHEAWPSGRGGFEGWGHGSTMVEHVKLNGVSDVLLISYGGFAARHCHQRVSDVVCYSPRHGMLTVVTTPSSSPSPPPAHAPLQCDELLPAGHHNDKDGLDRARTRAARPATAPTLPALIFHSVTRVAPFCYLVYGGRTNPTCPSGEAFLLECALDERGTTLLVRWSLMQQLPALDGVVPHAERATGEDRLATVNGKHTHEDEHARTDCSSRLLGDDRHGSVPPPRYRHCAIALPPAGAESARLFVYGGRDGRGDMRGDGWLAMVDVRHRQLRWRALHWVPAADATHTDAVVCAKTTTVDSSPTHLHTSHSVPSSWMGRVPPAMCAAAGVALSAHTVMLTGGLLDGERCSDACWLLTLDTAPATTRTVRCVCQCVPQVKLGARFAHSMTRVRVDGVAGVLVLGGCACEPRRRRAPAAVFVPVAHCCRSVGGAHTDCAKPSPRQPHGSGYATVESSDASSSAADTFRQDTTAGIALPVSAWRCDCGGDAHLSSSRAYPVCLTGPAVALARHDGVRLCDDDVDEKDDFTRSALLAWAAESVPLCAAALPLAAPHRDTTVAVVGGGYVCFSFGTFAPKPSLLHLGCSQGGKSHTAAAAAEAASCRACPTERVLSVSASPRRCDGGCDTVAAHSVTAQTTADSAPPRVGAVRRTREPHTADSVWWFDRLLSRRRAAVVARPYSAQTFAQVVRQASGPVVFRAVPFGRCLARWADPDYLCDTAGDTRVSVHVAHGPPLLDFVRKNFRFCHARFDELVRHVVKERVAGDDKNKKRSTDTEENNDDEEGEVWYFRSVAARMKTERAHFWHDFPALAGDFVLPPGAQEYVMPRIHQSCLRINAPPLQLWTHYDTLDNVLCQVVGRKRVVLFPPSAYNDLYMSGSSSAVVNLDAPDMVQYPRFTEACRQAVQVMLEPGDMLYFPAQWLHHITTLPGDYSISVNVFFDHFDRGEYDAKDLYGNKDLPACVRLRQDIVAAVTSRVQETRQIVTGAPMPPEYTEFALRQAIQDLEGVAAGMAAARRAERHAHEQQE